jgi:hypothetical protein
MVRDPETIFSTMLYSIRCTAAFHEKIRAVIPGILDCLKDSDWHVRCAVISTLSELSKNGT